MVINYEGAQYIIPDEWLEEHDEKLLNNQQANSITHTRYYMDGVAFLNKRDSEVAFYSKLTHNVTMCDECLHISILKDIVKGVEKYVRESR